MTMGRDGNRAKWERAKWAKWQKGEMGMLSGRKGEVGKGEMGRHHIAVSDPPFLSMLRSGVG
jgi:hypothetical protein